MVHVSNDINGFILLQQCGNKKNKLEQKIFTYFAFDFFGQSCIGFGEFSESLLFGVGFGSPGSAEGCQQTPHLGEFAVGDGEASVQDAGEPQEQLLIGPIEEGPGGGGCEAVELPLHRDFEILEGVEMTEMLGNFGLEIRMLGLGGGVPRGRRRGRRRRGG